MFPELLKKFEWMVEDRWTGRRRGLKTWVEKWIFAAGVLISHGDTDGVREHTPRVKYYTQEHYD